MPSPVELLLDGNWIKPETTGAPRFFYPFRLNGDRVSAYFEQDYLQQAATPTAPLPFVPSVLSIPHETLRDFYLISETPPVFGLANLLGFTRTFSRIPGTQVTYSSQAITKPNPSVFATTAGPTTLFDLTTSDSGILLGNAYSYLGYLWGNNSVYTEKPATSSLTIPTGGTFTLTYKTSTTGAIAYNAVNATIDAALNALPDVLADGLTFQSGTLLTTGGNGYISLTLIVGTTSALVTMNAASLTPSGATTAFNFFSSPTTQFVQIAVRVACASHAANTALPLLSDGVGGSAVSAGLWPYATKWLVIDANTLALAGRISLGSVGGITYIGQYYRAYTPGTDRVGTKLSQTFYLPGVTAGITTPADIPIPDPLLNDLALIAAVLAHPTGYQTYDSTALAQWMASPIYTQTAIQINMADL